MAKNDNKMNILYMFGIIMFFGMIYALFSYGSHRYCVMHEGFANQNSERKINDNKSHDISEDEIKKKTDQIQKLLDEVYEDLNFDKNIDDYEDLVDDLHDLVDANILNSIMKNKDGLTGDLTNAQSMTQIKDMNELGKFQDILKNMKTFLQKN
ncbi:MAG: hypothetical protein ACXABD_04985 [Candidatus Thorarchaeota archaeon]|jgi:hypothetical protein